VTTAALVVPLHAADLVPHAVLGATSWALMLVLQVWIALQARLIAGLPSTPRPVARFWHFVSAASAAFGAGSLTALVVAVRDTVRSTSRSRPSTRRCSAWARCSWSLE